MFCPQHQDFRLDSKALELLDACLGRFGLEFSGCAKVRDISEVNVQGVPSELPPQLPYGLKERLSFDVSDSAPYLGDHEIKRFFRSVQADPPFYLVGDVGHYLDSLAEVVTAPLPFNYAQVDFACRDTVVPGRPYPCEPLVMAEVQVCLLPVRRDVAFPMLIRVQCARIYVDVRVKLLNSDLIASGLQQFPKRGADYPFAKGGGHTSGYEYVFRLHLVQLMNSSSRYLGSGHRRLSTISSSLSMGRRIPARLSAISR